MYLIAFGYTENQLAPGKDVTDFQDKLIALLLQKGLSGKSGRRPEINGKHSNGRGFGLMCILEVLFQT